MEVIYGYAVVLEEPKQKVNIDDISALIVFSTGNKYIALKFAKSLAAEKSAYYSSKNRWANGENGTVVNIQKLAMRV